MAYRTKPSAHSSHGGGLLQLLILSARELFAELLLRRQQLSNLAVHRVHLLLLRLGHVLAHLLHPLAELLGLELRLLGALARSLQLGLELLVLEARLLELLLKLLLLALLATEQLERFHRSASRLLLDTE